MTTRRAQPVAIDEHAMLTLRELCHACGVSSDIVLRMVDEGVLFPHGTLPDEWRFSGRALVRAHRALRLTRDLRVNWPGAALALDLLDELEALRRERRLHARR